MTDLGTMLAHASGDGMRVQLLQGVTLSVDWATQLCKVQVDNGPEVPARMSGDVPRNGDRVWILLVGDLALTVGRPSRPPMATVNGSPSNGSVNVLSEDGNTYSVGYQTGYTPVSGHRVLMDWRAGGHILIRVDVDKPAPPAPAPQIPTPVDKSRQFSPIDSGSFRGGSWQTGSVYYGSSFPSAGYFYGPQIADTIPDLAVISSIYVYLEVTQSSGSATMPLFLHTSPTRPGGGLSLDQQINIGAMPNGFRGDVALPTAWGDLLKTGARWGIGTTGPGLRILRGTNVNAVAGAITINWKE